MEDSDTSTTEARTARLLPMLLWVGDPGIARRLRAVSEGDLKLQPVAVRTALLALKRKRDPANFLGQPQYRSTVPLVAEAVCEACMDAVVEALGDAADAPDREQVLTAIAEVGDRFPVSTVALMLAYVSVTDMPAADVCDEILRTDARFEAPA